MRHKNNNPQKTQELRIVANDENLALTKISDDNEPDELDNLPLSKLTKGLGYLKDGWILEDNEYICVKCDKVFKKRKPTKTDICKKCK
jgi:hypothetical protein